MRQLLTESLLLATGGSLVGLVATRVLIAAATREIPRQMPGLNATLLTVAVPLDGRVVLFAIVTCFVTVMTVGLVPAIAAVRTDLLSSLTSSGVVAPRERKSRLRRLVLIPQIALSLVLLLVAGVLVRSLLRLELAPSGYETIVAQADYQTTNRYRGATAGSVTPGYFKTLGIPLVRGRPFDARDIELPRKTAIVSERFANELWPGRDPLGERLAIHDPRSSAPPQWLEVAGVVRSVGQPLEEYSRPGVLRAAGRLVSKMDASGSRRR
jgi:hypothetical protein